MISNYQELTEIFEEVNTFPHENIFKFLYFYEKNINQVLYNEDTTINVDIFKLNYQFDEYYYLDLLIMDDEEIVNYEYSFDFIKEALTIYKT